MNNKPKLSVYQAINKSLISLNIKPDDKIRIYYQWELKKRIKPLQIPSIIVDYDKHKREWYIFYMDIDEKIFPTTIDDITGTIYTK